MIWVALWVLLAVGAGTTFGLIARSLYRRGKALVREASQAGERLSALTPALGGPSGPTDRASREADLAVFANPLELRRARFLRRRSHRPAGRDVRWRQRPEPRGHSHA